MPCATVFSGAAIKGRLSYVIIVVSVENENSTFVLQERRFDRCIFQGLVAEHEKSNSRRKGNHQLLREAIVIRTHDGPKNYAFLYVDTPYFGPDFSVPSRVTGKSGVSTSLLARL